MRLKTSFMKRSPREESSLSEHGQERVNKQRNRYNISSYQPALSCTLTRAPADIRACIDSTSPRPAYLKRSERPLLSREFTADNGTERFRPGSSRLSLDLSGCDSVSVFPTLFSLSLRGRPRFLVTGESGKGLSKVIYLGRLRVQSLKCFARSVGSWQRVKETVSDSRFFSSNASRPVPHQFLLGFAQI